MCSDRPLTAGQFVQLVLKYEWRIRGFTATMLGRAVDVDEVVQNSLLVAWEKLSSFSYKDAQPDEEFVRWVCTISRFQALRFRQKSAASRLVFGDALLDQLEAYQIEQSAHLESRHHALEACVEKLCDRDKNLIRRRYAGGDTVEQLAKCTGRTVSAIYKALKRIRTALMQCVERNMTQEGA